MSSYELLELLEFMPEDGAFKTAHRGREYTESEMTVRHLTSEVARLRATMHAVHGGQRYDPPVLLSRAQQVAEGDSAMAAEERREEFYHFVDHTPDEDGDI